MEIRAILVMTISAVGGLEDGDTYTYMTSADVVTKRGQIKLRIRIKTLKKRLFRNVPSSMDRAFSILCACTGHRILATSYRMK